MESMSLKNMECTFGNFTIQPKEYPWVRVTITGEGWNEEVGGLVAGMGPEGYTPPTVAPRFGEGESTPLWRWSRKTFLQRKQHEISCDADAADMVSYRGEGSISPRVTVGSHWGGRRRQEFKGSRE